MSPLAQGGLLSCLLILSVACYAVGSDRTNAISQMPTNAQEELFKKILAYGNVRMNENASQAEITKTGKLPEVINSLANGAIDVLVSHIPVIGSLLGPLIKGGLGALFSSFGRKKVYISNMPPVIICPSNIEVPQQKGKLSAIVNWQEPIGFDAEDGRISKVLRNGKKPGSRFSNEESIQYTVYDSKGRSDTCFMYIKVKIVRCPNVPLQRNRENTCSGPSFYGKSCHFSCSEGHTLIGPKTITCESDGRFDRQAPRCKITTCPQPELPHGGERWDCSDTYNYNSACTIKCKNGYRHSASNDRAPRTVPTIKCLGDSTWTPMPECKDVSPPEIINCPGFTLKTYADRGKNSTVVRWADIIATDLNNENVTVTQVKGPPSGSEFAKGAHEISYEAVDNVGLKDTCTFLVNVEVRRCPVPELTHEKVDIECGGHFNYGAACTISCVQGITLEGSSRITCEKNGNKMEWRYPNGQPTCIDPIRSVWVSTTPLPAGLKTGSSSVFALVGSNITASSDLAVDGIKSENFFNGDCFLSNTGDLNPIWIVNLGRAYHVYSVTILNRSHLSKTTVDVMQNNPLNGAAGTSTHCGTVTNESAGTTSPVVCEHKTVRQNQTYVPVFPAGRYIRLQKAGEYLLLCEVTIHVVAEHRNEVTFRIPTDK